MTPEDAFLLDVLANPDDPAPRLIYADWLEDKGDLRAKHVRDGCQVLAAPAGTSERRALRERFRLGLGEWTHEWAEVEGLVLTWRGVVAVFRFRLAEVIAWCAGRTLPLRSPALAPVAPGDAPDSWGLRVQRIAMKRTQELTRLGKAPRCLADDTAGGRLLSYLPGASTAAPAVHPRRAEYLDRSGCPPWDCWLAHGDEPDPDDGGAPPPGGYVLAWVPEHLVPDVSRAMTRRTGKSIRWAEDFDRPLVDHLREAGLVS
jgi:uncharacterized protein (TIGR02996 family)